MFPPGLAATALVLASAGAPDLHFERIGTEGGPPPAVITSLHQDRQGYLWIGSRNGLYRFDGYAYERFQHDPSAPGSLADNTVRTIHEESDGTLWFGTNTGGLDRFDPATRTFLHLRSDAADPRSLSHDSVYSILRDRRGALWVGTQRGLNVREPGSEGFVRMFAGGVEGLADDYVLTVFEDRGGRIWVGTFDGGLHLWDAELRRFTVYRHDPSRADSLHDDGVNALYEDDAGRLWVGTLAGLTVLDPGRGTFRRLREAAPSSSASRENPITAFAPGPPGRVWVARYGGGLAEVETSTGGLREWRQDRARRGGLAENTILSLCSDRSGALWIGTWGGGLQRLSRESGRFGGMTDARFPTALVQAPDVTTLLHDRRGNVWAGTRNGFLLRRDAATGRYATILKGGETGVTQTLLGLDEDRQGRIWIAANRGLLRFDPESGETSFWRHDPADPSSLGPGFVAAVLEDREGRLWVGTGEGGLQRLDEDGRVVQRFLGDDYVTVLLEDHEGTLWVGTRSGGLHAFEPATGSARRYGPIAGDPGSLGHHYVTALLEDSKHRLWVGTGGGGLNRVVPGGRDGRRFERVTKAEGLVDDDVTGLLEDDDGSLWIATRRGLSRFSPERKAFTNLFVSDGIPSAEFESGSAARSGDRLYFGAVRGLVALASGTAFETPPASPIVVRSVRTASGEVPDRAGPPDRGSIEIPYGAWMSIELALLDFNPELEHRYAYRLGPDWVEIGGRREITFTSLEPGSHDLRIRGRNAQGVWGETESPLRISVVPPFWMTLPFRLAALAAVVGLALTWHWRRTSALERRNRELTELHAQREKARQQLDDAYQRLRRLTRRLEAAKEDERHRIARELHDEMGPSLTAVIINLQLLATQRGTEQFARRVEDSVDLVDRLIQRIRDISLDLRPPLIDELGLAAALSGYLESVSERSGIRIDLKGDADLGPLPAHVPMTAFRVVQESVTNVLRHADATRIDVVVRREGARLDLGVEDDGKGFDVRETMQLAASGRALGLLGMQERVGMLHGEIEIDSRPGGGTRVRVRLPLAEAA